MLSALKKRLIQHCPELVVAYHSYRQSSGVRRNYFAQTPQGFVLSGHRAMQEGTFEPEETQLIRECLETADVFVDVGANIGYFACLARQLGKHVVAVEPLTQNLECLYANLNANAWTDVEVFPVGLAAKPGLADLYGGGTGASLLTRWSGVSEVWKRTIPLSTLDTLLGNRFAGQSLLIKIDVEGAEYAVLQGAAATIARTPSPAWLIEVCLDEHFPSGINPHFQEVFARFWDAGYEARTVGQDSRLVKPADVSRWIANRKRDFGFINYLFTKPTAD